MAWVETVDPASNRPYWYHAETGECRWENPDAAAAVWTAVVDEASGHTYYLNSQTHETTWERPADYQEPAADAEAAEAAGDEDPDPENWAEMQDEAGNTYFFHKTRRTSQWTKPAALEKAGSGGEGDAAAGDANQAEFAQITDALRAALAADTPEALRAAVAQGDSLSLRFSVTDIDMTLLGELSKAKKRLEELTAPPPSSSDDDEDDEGADVVQVPPTPPSSGMVSAPFAVVPDENSPRVKAGQRKKAGRRMSVRDMAAALNKQRHSIIQPAGSQLPLGASMPVIAEPTTEPSAAEFTAAAAPAAAPTLSAPPPVQVAPAPAPAPAPTAAPVVAPPPAAAPPTPRTALAATPGAEDAAVKLQTAFRGYSARVAVAAQQDEEFAEFEASIRRGLSVIKHPRKGKPDRRTLKLEERDDDWVLTWNGRHGKHGLSMSAVFGISCGINSPTLKRRRGKDPNLQNVALSLHTDRRTLDIEVGSTVERNRLARNFRRLAEEALAHLEGDMWEEDEEGEEGEESGDSGEEEEAEAGASA